MNMFLRKFRKLKKNKSKDKLQNNSTKVDNIKLDEQISKEEKSNTLTNEKEVITRITWAEPRKRATKKSIEEKNEENRQKLIEKVHELRRTPLPNGKYPTYREIAETLNISKTTVGDILNGKSNAKYSCRRINL